MRREYRKQKARARLFKHLQKTWKNKLIAIAMVLTGVLGVVLADDATALVFMLFIAIPMFFSKYDWTY